MLAYVFVFNKFKFVKLCATVRGCYNIDAVRWFFDIDIWKVIGTGTLEVGLKTSLGFLIRIQK